MRFRVLAIALALAACTKSKPVANVAAPKAAPAKPALLVPKPRQSQPCPGELALDAATPIAFESGARSAAEQLARWLGSTSLHEIAPAAADPTVGIALRLRSEMPDEAFTLDASSARAIVRARSHAGAFYGAQALAQLAGARRIETPAPPGKWSVPCVTVQDAPRVSFRAMHLDVVRHFFSRAVVERYIDLLAFYRFNVFHWHLTDDQGFRFEVKSHPELTAVGGRDGFYTQDDMRAVVAYAKERGITVLPEIEMPGHARAILASHPELSCTGAKQEVPRTWGVFDDVLCAGNEASYALIADVLGEVASVFPSPLVHIGGDEVPTKRWSACPKCRAAMAKHKVDAAGLEGVFMQRVAAMLAKLGKRPVVWDDASSDLLPPDAIVTAWQSKERGKEAAEHAHDVVMAPYQHVYFNMHQSHAPGEPGQVGYLPWSKVRVFDPIPEGLANPSRILGGEGAIWTEYIETIEQIETMAMPRMAALSETLWSGPAASESDFVARFTAQLPMLDASHVHYFVDPPQGLPERHVLLAGDKVTLTPAAPALFPQGVVRVEAETVPTATSPLFGPRTLTETTRLRSALFLPSGRQSPVVETTVSKEAARPASTVAVPMPAVGFAYAEGLFYKLPDFRTLKVKAHGHAREISLDAVRSLTPLRKERFALRFEGFVHVPTTSVYRFVARADDGVRIDVDGETISEDDGEHDARESSGQIALEAGYHRVVVVYFQGSEGAVLETKIEGRGLPGGPLELVVDAKGPHARDPEVY